MSSEAQRERLSFQILPNEASSAINTKRTGTTEVCAYMTLITRIKYRQKAAVFKIPLKFYLRLALLQHMQKKLPE